MPRPKRSRRICKVPEHLSFSPDSANKNDDDEKTSQAFRQLTSGMSVWLTNVAQTYSGKSGAGSSSIPDSQKVVLTLDEFETIRLVDYERQTHGQCAAQMDISRTTVTEIYESARQKIADCLVNGKHLFIEGGDYRICNGSAAYCCKKVCASSETKEKEE